MIVLCGNCRGLGSSEAVRQLSRIAKSCNPQILFLSETKLKEGEMESLKWRIGFECGIYVGCEGYGRSRRGGLAILWKRQIPVVLLSYSLHHIDVEIRDPVSWRFTGVYGWPKTEERANTWNLMKRLKDESPLPWLCGGDINEIQRSDEKRGGLAVHHSRMDAYQETMFFCNLRDVPQMGLRFTWSNGRMGEEHIECKLDRYMANAKWWESFSASYSEALPRIESDHSPIVCKILKEPLHQRRPYRFRFEEMWMQHEDLPNQIRIGWQRCREGLSFGERSQQCADVLKRWESEVFGHVRKQIRQLDEDISAEQARPLTAVSKAVIDNLLQKREEIRGREEAMWAQRSRISWLKGGDRNTKFFHKNATHRLHRNRIVEVKNNEGAIVKKEVEIQEVFRDFYVSLFSSTGSVRVESITSKVSPKITAEMKVALSVPFSKEEIRRALHQMHPSKAPGPDGLPPIFFQRYWNIVGEEVTNTTLAILNDGADPSAINDTSIVLIPKVKTPTSCSEYRPISLCNVIMKIVTKTIANRMKPILPDIIHENQGAFVPGRLLSDNSLIAFEVYHYLKKKTKGKKGFCALKLDMMKAYDRVEWNFLEVMMIALGFPADFVLLIMRCVCTVRYAVHINGVTGDHFLPSRGLRQGDPISPYLFLLCVEGLAAIIHHAALSGLIHGIRVARSAPSITHLFFADDSLMFARATTTELQNIMDILKLYEDASGQKINIQKCSLKFSRNLAEVEQNRLRSALGMRMASDDEKYLGLPTVIGRSKKEVFASMEERINGKVDNWRLRFLSKSGREVFIKAVLQAIPTFIMSCFILPADICERIEKKLGDIYWGSKEGERKLHWRSWARLCRPKNEGGLGFRKLKSFNTAMLAKQAWRLINDPTSLTARIFQARYFPRTNLLEAEIGHRPSHVWRGILAGLSLLKKGLSWRLGTGNAINIWNDSWISGSRLGHPKYMFPGSDHFQLVSELWCRETCSWKEDLLQLLFDSDDIVRIKACRLSPRHPSDTIRWKFTDDGMYSVKSGYRCDFSEWWMSVGPSSSQSVTREGWNSVWRLEGPPRLINFLWRLADNNIPVRENLRTRGIIDDSQCPLCNASPETVVHLFMDCQTSRRLMLSQGVIPVCQVRPSFALIWEELTKHRKMEECGKLLAVWWGLWRVRNLSVFENPNPAEAPRILARAVSYYEEYMAAQPRTDLVNSQSNIRWIPPPTGFMKINTDAGITLNQGGQVSAIARDEFGIFIQAAVKIIPAVLHPTLLEAYGVLLAFDLLREISCSKAIIESDCLPVVLALQSGSRSRSDLSIIIEDCLEVSQTFAEIRFNFVKRSANVPAHLLAKDQGPFTENVSFFAIPPCSINEALLQDVTNAV